MRNNQLFNGSLIFFLLIIGALTLGFITNKTKSWKVSNADIQTQVIAGNFVVDYYEFEKLLNAEGSNVLVVDMRPSKDFKKSHIKDAINFPAETAFERDVLKQLQKSKKPVLIYSQSQSESALYMMMFRSLGVENIKVLAGNYESWLLWSETKNPALNNFDEEKMRWNYRNLIKQDDAAPVTDVKPMMNRAKGGC